MLAKPEQYKGISFVRISSLPGDQKIKIKESYNRELIVKILKENSMINDCIIYEDYLKWYHSCVEPVQSSDSRIASSNGLKPSGLKIAKAKEHFIQLKN